MKRFLVGQVVFFGNTSGVVRDPLEDERWAVREHFTHRLFTVREDDMILAPHLVGPPSWIDMTPLERATVYHGRCCDCGVVLPLAIRATALRCDEHQEVYERAKQFDLAVGP